MYYIPQQLKEIFENKNTIGKLLYESLKFVEVVITFAKDKYQVVSMVVDPSYSKSGEHIREFCR